MTRTREKYVSEFGHSFLTPKQYAAEMERLASRPWNPEWGDETPTNRERVGRNIMAANKIWEDEDHGRFADVRELLALRLAPWLR